jgi:hypothetical protein
MGFSLPAGFSLDKFVQDYVAISLEFAPQSLSIDGFDRAVWERISTLYGVSPEFVGEMHHAFHWGFFCGGNGSPFTYNLQGGSKEEKYFVGLDANKLIGKDAVQRLASHILENSRAYLEARIEKFVNQTA